MTKTITSNSRKGVALLAIIGAVCALALALGGIMGCSPKQADPSASEQKTDPLMTQPVEWSMESDCETCHSQEAATMTDEKCPQASEHADLQCIQCHTTEDSLAESHNGLKYGDMEKTTDLKASKVTVDEKNCQTPECHGTMEEMAAQTEGKAYLTDSNGNQVNPHSYESNEQHDANQPTCVDCHKVHSEDIQKDATKWCAQCHHRGVFTCGNCHEIRERPVSHAA